MWPVPCDWRSLRCGIYRLLHRHFFPRVGSRSAGPRAWICVNPARRHDWMEMPRRGQPISTRPKQAGKENESEGASYGFLLGIRRVDPASRAGLVFQWLELAQISPARLAGPTMESETADFLNAIALSVGTSMGIHGV